MTTTPCTGCAVQQGTHQPAEALHQIAEPDAQHLQELAAYRFTVENLLARVAELEAQLASAQQAVPASAIAGAVFDFAGYLTTRPHNEAIHCSEAHEASPMVEAITEWCKRRGLCTDGANVENWRQAIATHPTQQGMEAPLIETCDEGGHKYAKLPDHPMRQGMPRCPHCMAIGLDRARTELAAQAKQGEQANG